MFDFDCRYFFPKLFYLNLLVNYSEIGFYVGKTMQGRWSIFSIEGTFEDGAWSYLGEVTQVYIGAPWKSMKKVKTCPSFVMGIMARRSEVQ